MGGAPAGSAPAGGDSTKKIIIAAIAVVVAILAIVLLFKACSSSSVENPELFEKGALVVGEYDEKEGKWYYGLVNEDGEEILDIDYEALRLIGNDLVVAGETQKKGEQVLGMKYALLTLEGEELTDYDYDGIGDTTDDGLILVWETSAGTENSPAKTEYGYIDEDGEEAIKLNFDGAGSFKDGMAPAKDDDEWGFIDTDGEWVIEPQFKSQPGDFKDGLAPVSKTDAKFGFITDDGEWVFTQKGSGSYSNYEDTWFPEGLLAVSDGKEWGFIDESGEWVIEAQFNAAANFTEDGLALVLDGTEWGYIDDNGEFVIEANFADAESFSEGLAKVKEDPEDDWYYIDTDGEEAFQGTYKYASSFKNGMACVSDDGEEYGYIDDSGEMVIKEQFASADSFCADGYAIVGEKDDKGIFEYYVIDEDGEAIWSETYGYIGINSEWNFDFRGSYN